MLPQGGWIETSPQVPQQRPDSNPEHPVFRRSSYVGCKVCDRGALRSKKAFRMSGPVVTIGFILLIPSILGILFSIGMLLLTVRASVNATLQARSAAVTEMRQHDIPEQIIEQVVDNPSMDVTQFLRDGDMDMASYSWLEDADSKLRSSDNAGGLGLMLGAGIFIPIGIASFVGGLLGWLLVMRKRALQCDVCGAVVNAS